MKIRICRKCGLPFFFSASYRHKNTGQIIRPKCARAFPIHIGGSCGQTFMPFMLNP